MARKPVLSISLRNDELQDFARKMQLLDDKMKNKIMGNAMLAGGKVALEATKPLVPARTGQLRKSLAVVRVPKNWFIGARLLARRKGFPGGYYAHLIEKGHKIYMTTKNKRKVYVGYYSPHPFMRPAVEMNRPRILDTVAAEAAKGIQDFARQNR